MRVVRESQLLRRDSRSETQDGEQKRGIFGLVMSCLVILSLAGCGGSSDIEVSAAKPHDDLVGTEYVVLANDLYAHGILGDWPDKAITYGTLIPGVGIDGYEVAFKTHIPKGTIIRIDSVWQRRLMFEHVTYYVVTCENVHLPSDVPVRLELTRGNEEGTALNPNVYKRRQR